MTPSECIHCAKALLHGTSNKDHIPSKHLLVEPYPLNLSTVKICKACNSGFSDDEEYLAAFLGMLLTDDDNSNIDRLERAIDRNWKLQDHFIDRMGVSEENEDLRIFVEPENERLQRVVCKNARGHLFLDFKLILNDPPDSVSHCQLEQIPEKSRSQLFGDTEGWRVIQKGIYRYYAATTPSYNLVRSVIHEHLATETVWQLS